MASVRSYYWRVVRRGGGDARGFVYRQGLLMGGGMAVLGGFLEAQLNADADLLSVVASAGLAVMLMTGLVFLVNLFLAPGRLDRELRADKRQVESERDALRAQLNWRPEFDVSPSVGSIMREIDGGYAYDKEAVLWVANASDQGGEEAVARGVTPEIQILYGGAVHTSNVGWEEVASRDLRPTRERYPVHVAFKQAGATFPTADLRSPTQTMGGPLWGPKCDVRLKLRGDNWQTPIVYDFVLRNVRDAHGGLRLERAA